MLFATAAMFVFIDQKDWQDLKNTEREAFQRYAVD